MIGICKVEKILKGSLDSIPSPSVKIQMFDIELAVPTVFPLIVSFLELFPSLNKFLWQQFNLGSIHI